MGKLRVYFKKRRKVCATCLGTNLLQIYVETYKFCDVFKKEMGLHVHGL